MKKKYVLLLITILWIGFIFYMSSQPAEESSNSSSRIVNIVLHTLNLDKSNEDVLTVIVRKGAHFTEYLILSGLVTVTYGAFNNKKNYSFILLVCILVALSDEFLQSFIIGRSSEVRDVLIDFSGALIFFLVNYVITNLKLFKKGI
ncbi:MAG: VanZ family protein [Clostridium sp.]